MKSSESKLIVLLAQKLQQQAIEQNQRRTLLLSGESGWCRSLAVLLVDTLSPSVCHWIGEPWAEMNVLSNRQANQLLGGECSLLVYDAFSGFDADAFAAVSGTLCGGGLLVLLTPSFSQWPQFSDPTYSRLLVANYHLSQIKGCFIRHLMTELNDAEGVLHCQQGDELPQLSSQVPPLLPEAVPAPYLSRGQAQVVQAIQQVLQGHRNRPLVVTADRGRGKSGALGLAVGQLLQQGIKRILVTAPRRNALNSLYVQALQCLPEARLEGNTLYWQQGMLQFIAPDQLLLQQPSADLLLVDEAAAIPIDLLQKMLHHYSRIVFSSTVHGYEGSGRGFAIRFKKILDKQTPGWQSLELIQPLRWADNDSLENWVFKALCLDAELVDVQDLASISSGSCTVSCINRDQLLQQPALLREVFALLVNAHYRTTPSDLQNLLDGPNISLYIMQSTTKQVVGVLLLAAEGGFDESMALQIQQGRRRPRGHLLAQTLSAQLGVLKGAQLRSARVMRIAIHPALQRQELGRALLDAVRTKSVEQGFDLLGASFAASIELLCFWQAQNLQPVLLGLGRESSSGAHTSLFLQALSEPGRVIFNQARLRGRRLLLAQLAEPLHDLEPELALCLLKQQAELPLPDLDVQDMCDLNSFAYHQRGYELTLHALQPLAQWGLVNQPAGLNEAQQTLLLKRVLLQHDWASCDYAGSCGRKPLLRALREMTQLLLVSLAAMD